MDECEHTARYMKTNFILFNFACYTASRRIESVLRYYIPTVSILFAAQRGTVGYSGNVTCSNAI
jgi:hypothetical protein